jgi:hypothetical protein
MDEKRQWHRWFGLCWADFFTGLPVTVEMEKDLSIKQQFLDVVIVRKGNEPLPRRPPDGFEELGPHNLISFKSFQEALDGWALMELVGHYVNYRKQVSPDLSPEDDFRLFAVCVRYPEKLANRCALQRLQEGVYRIEFFDASLRLIVTNELAREEHNAMLHLFSYKEDLLRYGEQHYRPYSPQTTTFLHQLYAQYALEGIMPFTYEQGVQEALQDIIRGMPVEKRIEGVPVEKLLEHVPPEKRLEGVPVEKRLEGVPLEKRLEGLSLEEILNALPPQAREELLRRTQGSAPPVPPESSSK